jgi:hypothetical protein
VAVRPIRRAPDQAACLAAAGRGRCGRRRACAFGSPRGRTAVPRIVDWYVQGKLDIDDLITPTLKLEDINEGFDLMTSGASIRSVVVYRRAGVRPLRPPRPRAAFRR